MIRLKSADEINRIRESCRMLTEVFSGIRRIVQEGITTIEIDRFANDQIVKRGGKPAFLGYSGYPASVCISVNEEIIHGIPGKRVLKNGDIVSLDMGINLKGYYSDAAVTLPVGNISSEAERLLNTTRKALYAGINACVNGNRIKDISAAVYKHAEAEGFGVVREYCGHGVGFDVHEAPQVPNYVHPGPNPRIRKGLVVAIEPMINAGTGSIELLDDEWTVVTADNRYSAHFEHTVAVFEDYTEILTELD